MSTEHAGVPDALLDGDAAYVVMSNDSDGPIQVKQGTRLGTVHEFEYHTAQAYRVDLADVRGLLDSEFDLSNERHADLSTKH
jgi:hypothetical protein